MKDKEQISASGFGVGPLNCEVGGDTELPADSLYNLQSKSVCRVNLRTRSAVGAAATEAVGDAVVEVKVLVKSSALDCCNLLQKSFCES